MDIFGGDATASRQCIGLTATNYGPTDITLHSHIAKEKRSWFMFRKNQKIAMINTIANPDSDSPSGFFAPGFPKKLSVGEAVTVYFSAEGPKRWVEENNLYRFGFSDTFGRCHWCSEANAKKFRDDVVSSFGALPSREETVWRRIAPAVRRRLNYFRHSIETVKEFRHRFKKMNIPWLRGHQ